MMIQRFCCITRSSSRLTTYCHHFCGSLVIQCESNRTGSIHDSIVLRCVIVTTMSFRPLISSLLSPVSDLRSYLWSPISGLRSLVSDLQSPISGLRHRPPISGLRHRPPVSNIGLRSPVSDIGLRSPVSDLQSPVSNIGLRSPVSNIGLRSLVCDIGLHPSPHGLTLIIIAIVSCYLFGLGPVGLHQSLHLDTA
jgi:hypothetical protein